MEPGTIIDAQHLPPPAPSVQPPSNHVKRSHRMIFLYLALLLVAVLIGSVYAWQHSQVVSTQKKNKLLAAQVVQLQSQVKVLSAPVPGANNNNSPLAYKDWETYCDYINDSCFRYPKDWTIVGTSNSSKASVTITNPRGTVKVQYIDPITSDITNQIFYISSIKDMNKTDLGIKIAGRTSGNTPDYVVVDSTYLDTNHIAVKKTQSFMDDARFTSKTNNTSTQLMATPTGSTLSTFKTTDKALSWFDSTDAKTSLKILQSFYYQ